MVTGQAVLHYSMGLVNNTTTHSLWRRTLRADWSGRLAQHEEGLRGACVVSFRPKDVQGSSTFLPPPSVTLRACSEASPGAALHPLPF